MSVTLELSAEQEQRLLEGAASADADAMRQVLLQAIESTIERLLAISARAKSTSDFEALADRLAAKFAATAGPNDRPLPDEAITRDGIYGDHP